jgi:hypothetical protein
LYHSEIVLHEGIHMSSTCLCLHVFLSQVLPLLLAFFLLLEFLFAPHLLHRVPDDPVLNETARLVLSHFN